jgi:DNA-binding FrmR family transcriptional regulator
VRCAVEACGAGCVRRYVIPPYPMYNCRMSHTIREKQKLLIRVRRLRGQVEAIERALEEESGCDKVMHLIAGVKGATSSLMAEVMEDHVRQHFVEAKRRPDASMADAAEQLIDVVHAYLK